MNNKILNLDNKIKLKKTIKNNITYLIKNYGKIINYIKTPFISYRKDYIVSILYNKIKILLIIEEIYNPLTMNEEYIISTTNSENNNNTEYSNNNSYLGWPAFEIKFLNNEFKKNEAYISSISRNKKHKVDSGTIAIKLAIRICSYLNINYAYLGDDSLVKCKINNQLSNSNENEMSLKLLKLLTIGNTWYEKMGFKLNVKDYSKINASIIKVQKIKMEDILKINIKMRNIISKVIENGSISKIKFWYPPISKYIYPTIQFLNKCYLFLSQNIIMLKKYIKKGDTIKSYSERISKDNCNIFIKTIQNIFYENNGLNTDYSVRYMFIMFYDDNVIAYPHINEVYTFKTLVNTEIYYKRKI